MLLLEDEGTWTDLSPEPAPACCSRKRIAVCWVPVTAACPAMTSPINFGPLPNAPRHFAVATLSWDNVGELSPTRHERFRRVSRSPTTHIQIVFDSVGVRTQLGFSP